MFVSLCSRPLGWKTRWTAKESLFNFLAIPKGNKAMNRDWCYCIISHHHQGLPRLLFSSQRHWLMGAESGTQVTVPWQVSVQVTPRAHMRPEREKCIACYEDPPVEEDLPQCKVIISVFGAWPTQKNNSVKNSCTNFLLRYRWTVWAYDWREFRGITFGLDLECGKISNRRTVNEPC